MLRRRRTINVHTTWFSLAPPLPSWFWLQVGRRVKDKKLLSGDLDKIQEVVDECRAKYEKYLTTKGEKV